MGHTEIKCVRYSSLHSARLQAKVTTEDYAVERGVENKDRRGWSRAEVDERNQGTARALTTGVIMEAGWRRDRAERETVQTRIGKRSAGTRTSQKSNSQIFQG